MTIDVDSTICEVHGHHKGAAYGSTRQLGDHPLLATPARCSTCACARARPTPPAGRAVRQRAGRPCPPGRRQRPVDAAGRLRVLVRQEHDRLPAAPDPVLHHDAPDPAGAGGHRRHPEPAWIEIDYPTAASLRSPRPGWRASGWGAPHPPDRPPGHPVARLAPPRLRHRSGRRRHGAGRRSPRLTRSARRRRLHRSSGWPWAAPFLHALARLRALPAPG
jgi:hypothetical protein